MTNISGLLDDLEWELTETDPAQRTAAFEIMVNEHPTLAARLTGFFIELTLDDERRDSSDIEAPVAADDPLVSSAMERFTAALDRYR